MKLIFREYLAQLREREELDALLPDLLSELGFHVYSRPQRGTTQHGVDIAAVGSYPPGAQKKVHLLSVKRGDLGRPDWNSGDQSLRPSLDQIRDVYIRTKIPRQYRDLPIVVCLVVGGDVKETVQSDVRGYIEDNTTDRVAYVEWNGDYLAEMMMVGLLRENLLAGEMRSHFRKAVALVDEPDVAYRHFSALVSDLRFAGSKALKARVRAARQIYICAWVLFVWARDRKNVEAAYQASELALLNVWDMIRTVVRTKSREAKALFRVLDQTMKLHLQIADLLIEQGIAPVAGVRDAAGWAVASRSSTDVNLALFDVLGRIAMQGLWILWLSDAAPDTKEAALASVDRHIEIGFALIENNGALGLPIADEQATAVALFLLLWTRGRNGPDLRPWLHEMAGRYRFAVQIGRYYPTSKTEYRELIVHPVEASEAYFKEATAGSTLIPLMVAWLTALGDNEGAAVLAKISADRMQHCAMQLWSVTDTSEAHLYCNDGMHGQAIMDLPVNSGTELLDALKDACDAHTYFRDLSAVQYNWWPIVLLACRHWRLPVPVEFYLPALLSAASESREKHGDA